MIDITKFHTVNFHSMTIIKFHVFLIFLFASISCGQSDQSLSQTTEIVNTQPIKISIGTPRTPPNWLTLIALQKGYMKDEGLNATEVYFPSGKRALNGMFAGKVDIAATAVGPIVFKSMTRNDFSVIASIGTSSNDNVIVARKDRSIQQGSDLKNKRIATQEASAAHFYMHLFLIKNKMLEKDVKTSFMKVEDLPKALIRGDVDAISTREPFYSEAVQSLGDNAIVFETPGLYLKSFALVASTDYIKRNNEAVNKLLKALIRAEQYVKENREQSYKLISELISLPKDRIKDTMQYLDLRITLDQAFLLKLEDEARWVINSKLTDASNVPNYLNFLNPHALKSIKPSAMTIVSQ